MIYPVDSAIRRLNNQGLAPVVQTLDSAIHRINHYSADKYYKNQLRNPVDSNLSNGSRYPPFEQMGPGRLVRSSYQLLLSTPKFNLKTYGGRSSTIAAFSVGNALPFELRSCHSLSSFKSKLKTWLLKVFLWCCLIEWWCFIGRWCSFIGFWFSFC